MQVNITRLVNGGSGMGEISGKKIFVPYSAPGDVLDVEVLEDHGGFAKGRIASIIKPSPCRTTPACPVFGECGGCQWQHISYEAQLKWKREILIESLSRIGKIKAPQVLPTMPSPRQWHYRNRIQLHVDSNGRVGFYKTGTKEVIVFEECAIAAEKLNTALKLRRPEISGRDCGIALRLNDTAAFEQINSEQNEQLKKLIADWLGEAPHRTILELYSGTGNFTFAISEIAEHVVASDIDGRAIKIAKARQIELQVRNVEFVCAPAARASRRLHGNCDAILVDPPRKGCAEAIDSIVEIEPQTIIYISCDPATLARDALALSAHGYNLQRSIPVDMFPQIFHVESVSLFSRDYSGGGIL